MNSYNYCLIHAAGAAFSKHLVHLYAYAGPNDLRQHLEVCYNLLDCDKVNFATFFFICIFLCLQIDAHTGGVNDLAFAHPNKQLCVVTCGDDKLIKVVLKKKQRINLVEFIIY